MAEQKKSKTRWQKIRENGVWKKKHLILLGMGVISVLVGAIMGGYPMIFFGLILIGFALAMWYGAVKHWFGLDKLNIGAGSLKTHIIAEYGPEIPRDKKLSELTGDNFFGSFLRGENEKTNEYQPKQHKEFFSGIRYCFTKTQIDQMQFTDEQRDKFDKSQEKLNALLEAYNGKREEDGTLTEIGYIQRKKIKDKDGKDTDKVEIINHDKGKIALEAFFYDQITEYIKAKIADERRHYGDNEKDYGLRSTEDYRKKDQEKEIEQLAIKMAEAFYKYLEIRKGKFELEDFKLKDNNGKIVEDEDEKAKNFLLEFIKQDIKKQNIEGWRGYKKFMLQGTILGGIAGSVIAIIETAVPKFGIGMAKMYGSASGLAGGIGILIGIIITALIFAVGRYVYSNKEPDLPKGLKLTHPPKQEDSITPVTNPIKS